MILLLWLFASQIYKALPVIIWIVYCDRWRHVTQKGQGRDPIVFDARYRENGWRYTFGDNGAGNSNLGIKWSRDRWRQVTQKGQGRDPNMLRAQYLENGWR